MSLSYLAYRQEAVTILDNKYKVLTDCMLKPPLLTNCYSVDKMKFSKTLYFWQKHWYICSKCCICKPIPDICCCLFFILKTKYCLWQCLFRWLHYTENKIIFYIILFPRFLVFTLWHRQGDFHGSHKCYYTGTYWLCVYIKCQLIFSF